MFVNLSNHPVAKWSEGQLSAAALLSDGLADFPFPDVNPLWDCGTIRLTAQSVVDEVLASYGVEGTVVHVMGEFNLAFAMVKLFQAAGVRCVASCSARQVEDQGDGTKVVRFEFVQFREYVSLNQK